VKKKRAGERFQFISARANVRLVVVEPPEFVQYAEIISEKQILALPFSNLGKRV